MVLPVVEPKVVADQVVAVQVVADQGAADQGAVVLEAVAVRGTNEVAARAAMTMTAPDVLHARNPNK